MTNRMMPLWALGALLCVTAVSAGCVTVADEELAAGGAAARVDDPDDPGLDPATAAGAATVQHGSAQEVLVAALRTTGVADYDVSLGELDWSNATLEHFDERDADVVIVPIVHGAQPRALVARVQPGPRGPTFQTAVLDLAIDPVTGEYRADGVRGADGTSRALPGGGGQSCVSSCVNVMWPACYPCQIDENPSVCLLNCAVTVILSCELHCWLLWWWWWIS